MILIKTGMLLIFVQEINKQKYFAEPCPFMLSTVAISIYMYLGQRSDVGQHHMTCMGKTIVYSAQVCLNL